MEGKSDEESQQGSIESTKDFIAKLRRSSRNRESHDEIASLESELRRAYIVKELETQLIERQTERYIENVRKRRAAKETLLEQQAVHEKELRQRSEDQKKSEEYRKELSDQIKIKEEARNAILEEDRREREVLEEVDRIREEKEKMMAERTKTERMENLRRELSILEEMKEIRRQEDAEAEEKKLRDDELYHREVELREEKMKKLREEQKERREKTLQDIARVLTSTETEKLEREALMNELVAEDLKRELSIREEEERARRRRMREELAAELEDQIVFTEKCKIRFVEQDRAFAEEIMKRVMEDERVAKLTADARRRMQARYREELARLIETRRKIRLEEIDKMKEAAKEMKEREKIRLEKVMEDRKRLLEQHATNVAGFIDKSVLTEEEQRVIQEASIKQGSKENNDREKV